MIKTGNKSKYDEYILPDIFICIPVVKCEKDCKFINFLLINMSLKTFFTS